MPFDHRPSIGIGFSLRYTSPRAPRSDFTGAWASAIGRSAAKPQAFSAGRVAMVAFVNNRNIYNGTRHDNGTRHARTRDMDVYMRTLHFPLSTLHSFSMICMSMLRFFGLKLMPTSGADAR